MRTTRLVVNLDNINNNIENIKKFIGSDVDFLPVIKANGYGTHINMMLPFLEQFNYVAVALVDEAIALRDLRYKKKILVLNPSGLEELPSYIKYDLTVSACSIEMIKTLSEMTSKKITVHLEIETGMNRTGIKINDLSNFIEELMKLDNILVEGVFTHLSSNNDIKYSTNQITIFNQAIKILKDYNLSFKYVHAYSSGGLLNNKDQLYNMVRIGIMMYGYYPLEELKTKIKLYPSAVLKTKINFLKTIDQGEAVGYGQVFIANRKTKVATIPFGYADGLTSLDIKDAYVIINKQKAKIIAICMDSMMLDVTDISDVSLETDVYLWDNDLLTVEEVGKWCNKIRSYEIISSLTNRVPREFISE